jgi:uncharacterized protein DUF2071
MDPKLEEISHRPWPLPACRWVMAQSWHDLLFAHWPVDISALRKAVPSALAIDTYQGQAWLGVVPFRMSGVRLRGTPPVPWLSAFPELNVRTYVVAEGKPGVWFSAWMPRIELPWRSPGNGFIFRISERGWPVANAMDGFSTEAYAHMPARLAESSAAVTEQLDQHF